MALGDQLAEWEALPKQGSKKPVIEITLRQTLRDTAPLNIPASTRQKGPHSPGMRAHRMAPGHFAVTAHRLTELSKAHNDDTPLAPATSLLLSCTLKDDRTPNSAKKKAVKGNVRLTARF